MYREESAPVKTTGKRGRRAFGWRVFDTLGERPKRLNITLCRPRIDSNSRVYKKLIELMKGS